MTTIPTVTFNDTISASDAIDILNTTECTVILSTASGEFHTHPGIHDNLIKVDGAFEYVHVHNIQAIKYQSANNQISEFIAVDWDRKD